MEWEDSTKQARCFVMWRTPEEWAALIFQWVTSKGLTSTVCTFYDLHSSDDASDQGKPPVTSNCCLVEQHLNFIADLTVTQIYCYVFCVADAE